MLKFNALLVAFFFLRFMSSQLFCYQGTWFDKICFFFSINFNSWAYLGNSFYSTIYSQTHCSYDHFYIKFRIQNINSQSHFLSPLNELRPFFVSTHTSLNSHAVTPTQSSSLHQQFFCNEKINKQNIDQRGSMHVNRLMLSS